MNLQRDHVGPSPRPSFLNLLENVVIRDLKRYIEADLENQSQMLGIFQVREGLTPKVEPTGCAIQANEQQAPGSPRLQGSPEATHCGVFEGVPRLAPGMQTI